MKDLLSKLRRGEEPECEEVRDLFSDYLDRDLPAEQHRAVEDHVGICPPCRRVLSNLAHTIGALAHLGERHEPDEQDQVAERVRASWRERH